MARDDVRRVLEVLADDEEVADRLASGDLTDLAELDLTADEQVLVQDAASDLPEVAGFTSQYVHKHLAGLKYEDVPVDFGSGIMSDKFNVALKYSLGK